MTVALSLHFGDKGDARGDAVTAAGVALDCFSPALRHLLCAAARRGSRFWALAEDSSEDDDDVASVRSSRSPRSPPRPSQVTVGDFLSEAFANPSAGFMCAGRRKRSAFAPGGRGPRWLSRPAAGERRRKPSPSSIHLCDSLARAARTVAPACASVSSSLPLLASYLSPHSLAPAGAPDLDPNPSPVVAPAPPAPSGQRETTTSGPPVRVAYRAPPVVGPASKAHPRPRGDRYKWVWKPVGSSLATIGFPALPQIQIQGASPHLRPASLLTAGHGP
jgi:hypothetical protein